MRRRATANGRGQLKPARADRPARAAKRTRARRSALSTDLVRGRNESHRLARAADNKDRWVLALDPATGKTRVIVNDHDDAWIGGPGAFTIGWMKDNKTIYFQSERRRLFTSVHGCLRRRRTEAAHIRQVGGHRCSVVRRQDRFLLTTSEVHPGERHFYSMPAEGR